MGEQTSGAAFGKAVGILIVAAMLTIALSAAVFVIVGLWTSIAEMIR